MTDAGTIFTVLLVATGLPYLYLIITYSYGWFRLREYQSPEPSREMRTPVTIIVPARNEEKTIGNLLEDLLRQDYPDRHTEIIVVDDSSEDKTAEVVAKIMEENEQKKIRLLTIKEEHPDAPYKKKAIALAISRSSGRLIVTTDADCEMGPHWLSSLVFLYEKEGPRMILGPVSYHRERSFFEKMQTLEFLSLIAITAGAIRIGKPIMCNGANLAYEKEAWLSAGGFGEDRFSSGDDVFLLLKIRKQFGPRSIRFLKSREALVYTRPQKKPADFLNQRVRWASKNKGYDLQILIVSFTVYLMNLLMVAGFLLAIWLPALLPVMVVAYLAKLAAELPVLFGISGFVRRKSVILYAAPLLVLYPLYIVVTAALGILGKYRWKDRKIKN